MQQPPGGYPPKQGYAPQGYPPPQQAFPPQGGYVPQQQASTWGAQYPPGQQGFGWGQQSGPGPGRRPPKRRSAAPVVAVLSILALLVAGGAVVAALVLRGEAGRVAVARPTGRPSTSVSPPPVPTNPATTQPTAAPTGPLPTTRPTPPPPRPRTRPKPPPSPRQVLTGSRIYATGTHPSLGCAEPGVRPTSVPNVAAYNTALKACLDRAWPRQERAGGFRARPPRMIHFSGVASSPCSGGVTQRSFYCSANETIYMYVTEPLQMYREWGRAGGAAGRTAARMRMLHVVAHEYGHHVQEVSGILEAYHELRYAASSPDGVLLLSRQAELQASCFAAVFVGANRRTLPVSGAVRKEWDWVVAHSGDRPPYPRDHGSYANHNFWSKRGFNDRTPGACNTFTGSPRFSS